MPTYDAVIVGGRMAGASTALLLARAGARVVVLDRSPYGSDTVSTHALMRAGVLQLSRWGVLEQLVDAGTPPIGRVLFHYADGETVQVSVRPSRGVPALYAPRRTLVDRVLVDAAAAAGADVRHDMSATGLRQDRDGRVTGVEVAGRDGTRSFVRSRTVVGADGIRSTVADAVGAPVVRSAQAAGAVLYRYYDGLPAAGYEWAYGDRVAAGLVPTNDGRTCVFVSASADRIRVLRRDGAESAFASLFAAAAPGRFTALDDAHPVGVVRGWAARPGFARRPWGPGWALVGDAGYFRDPITSHGMTDALRDAELLADALLAAWSGVAPEPETLAHYQAVRDAVSAQMFEATEAIARYDWDLAQIRRLLRQVSSAMSDEVELLQDLPDRRGSTVSPPFIHADTLVARR